MWGHRSILCVLSLSALFCCTNCAGAGPYGYARSYAPLSEEQPWIARAQDPVYDDVRRMPESYRGEVISFFGVVTAISTEHAETRIAMQVRTHQDRHLCDDESERSCRVTVNARDGGPFTAIVQLRPDDLSGENRVQVNSLLRVFGTVVSGEYDSDGGPVLRAAYYRHWPRGQYVTTNAAGSMRR